MKKEIAESKRKTNSKVGFSSLYKVFRIRVISHFFLVFTVIALSSYLALTNNEIFSERRRLHFSGNDDCCGSGGAHVHVNSASNDYVEANTSSCKDSKGNYHVDSEDSKHNSSTVENGEEYGKYLPLWNY